MKIGNHLHLDFEMVLAVFAVGRGGAGVGAMPSENISLSDSKTFSAKAKFSFEAIKTYLAQMAATAQNKKERRGGRVKHGSKFSGRVISKYLKPKKNNRHNMGRFSMVKDLNRVWMPHSSPLCLLGNQEFS